MAEKHSTQRYLSIEHLWPLTVLIGIFVFLNTHPIRPHDFWWHIAVGREIIATGHIPLVDTFSYTAAGTPYPSYQMFWLIETALYLVYRAGGVALVVFVHSLTVAAAYALLLWLGKRISGSWRAAAFGALFAAALGLHDWNVRPQAVTFAIAALFLLAIHEYRQTARRRWLLAFPLGMALWVNSHGTFPIGLLLIGTWLADAMWEALRAWLRGQRIDKKTLVAPAGALAIALLACLLNPRGVGIIAYVATLSTNPVVQNLVPEWSPPTFSALGGQLFLGGLLLSATLLALSPRRPTFFQMALFLGFAALGLKTQRGSIWFGLVMAPTLAEHFAHLGGASLRRAAQRPTARVQGTLNTLLAGLFLLAALASLPWFKALWPLPPEKAGLISAETPVDATAYLVERRLPGQVFHTMAYGSYLIWAAPDYPTFVDGRIELFPAEVWLDYLRISAAGPGWEELAARYGVNTLLLSTQEQATLIAAALASPHWEQVYGDDVAVVFTRRD